MLWRFWQVLKQMSQISRASQLGPSWPGDLELVTVPTGTPWRRCLFPISFINAHERSCKTGIRNIASEMPSKLNKNAPVSSYIMMVRGKVCPLSRRTIWKISAKLQNEHAKLKQPKYFSVMGKQITELQNSISNKHGWMIPASNDMDGHATYQLNERKQGQGDYRNYDTIHNSSN